MLEEELAKEERKQKPAEEVPVESQENKYSFLKRKESITKKSQTSTAKKSYRYYLDNFQQKAGEEKPNSRNPNSF